MLKGKDASNEVFGTKNNFALFSHSWKYDETRNGDILPNLINLITNILL